MCMDAWNLFIYLHSPLPIHWFANSFAHSKSATDLHPRHPKWVGAWWLGYIVFGAAAIVAAFPVFLFPRRLRGAPTREEPVRKTTEVVNGDTKRFQAKKEIKSNKLMNIDDS